MVAIVVVFDCRGVVVCVKGVVVAGVATTCEEGVKAGWPSGSAAACEKVCSPGREGVPWAKGKAGQGYGVLGPERPTVTVAPGVIQALGEGARVVVEDVSDGERERVPPVGGGVGRSVVMIVGVDAIKGEPRLVSSVFGNGKRGCSALGLLESSLSKL